MTEHRELKYVIKASNSSKGSLVRAVAASCELRNFLSQIISCDILTKTCEQHMGFMDFMSCSFVNFILRRVLSISKTSSGSKNKNRHL